MNFGSELPLAQGVEFDENKIGIIGSGNIGWAIKKLLKDTYDLKIGDLKDGLDATSEEQVKKFLEGSEAVISAGPYAVNKTIARLRLILVLATLI